MRLLILTYQSATASARPEATAALFSAIFLAHNLTYFEFQVDDQAVFPAEEVYQQLHEDVQDVGLVARKSLKRRIALHVPDRAEIEGLRGQHDGQPGHYRIDLCDT